MLGLVFMLYWYGLYMFWDSWVSLSDKFHNPAENLILKKLNME